MDSGVVCLGIDMNELLDKAESASTFLKALANENRLVILCCLADGEKNVSDLETFLDIRQPTLSQQLARLREEGLVVTRRQSKQIFYSIASIEVKQMISLIYELFCSAGARGLDDDLGSSDKAA